MKTAETKVASDVTEEQRTILKTLFRAGEPWGTKDIAATSGTGEQADSQPVDTSEEKGTRREPGSL